MEATTEDGTQLGWNSAAELIKPFGTVAANFAEAIRLLVAAHSAGTNPLPPSAETHIVRLIKNDTVKATYYYFTKQFRPNLLTGEPLLTERDIFRTYSAIDHAAILTFCYLFKTLGRRIEKEEWEYVQTPLYEALAIGGFIGQSVKEIGLGIGLLARGTRYLAFAAFMRENRKAFKEYRQHLKQSDLAFDTEFEQRMWQCSTSQIAALLLERMGYPRVAGIQLLAAAERSKKIQADPIFGTPFRLAECLLDAYMEGHEIPTSTPTWVGKEIDLPAEVRGTLLAALNKVFADKNRIDWLNKTGADLSPSLTPELFPNEQTDQA
ncbi:MAG: hypothetical protein ACK5Y6_04635 [Pseudomonadota bacterium]|jgi:hypothetical protein